MKRLKILFVSWKNQWAVSETPTVGDAVFWVNAAGEEMEAKVININGNVMRLESLGPVWIDGHAANVFERQFIVV